jgi:hypothetical protein
MHLDRPGNTPGPVILTHLIEQSHWHYPEMEKERSKT